ncbi:hypothetical protein ACE1ET_20200 [Saccharicrinis sp. FJH62]|uniref:hypothetical protein n=1 Tax=Saccharicrinis sp. FJH62 TaxID=3344657 RepID=UPI0035D3F0CB
MNKVKLIILTLSLFSFNCFSQIDKVSIRQKEDTLKCNFNILRQLRDNIENLDSSMISVFLMTIDKSCFNNVEFSEASNYWLFKTVETNPELFVKTYSNISDKIDTAFILFELRNPINDLIPIDSIINQVEQLEFDNNSKKQILLNLKKGDWTK